jgi:hypothetical protein
MQKPFDIQRVYRACRALQFPGIAWRVSVVPPAAVAEAEAMGNVSRAAAHLARNTRQAVLRVSGWALCCSYICSALHRQT